MVQLVLGDPALSGQHGFLPEINTKGGLGVFVKQSGGTLTTCAKLLILGV